MVDKCPNVSEPEARLYSNPNPRSTWCFIGSGETKVVVLFLVLKLSQTISSRRERALYDQRCDVFKSLVSSHD